ncbi:hypothetical protein BDQ12DRAFT_726584 [Crucibulum laeve]|uniref:T6SS Phospholipase effector Tle1-like catalytic domain-containing protein n=1 Tax=Crucibulum laeve TaxID=68775 RepID=A0A5C3LQ32_9AGAR|nr:hypothetical protein BDQ12DRAFT_726584 [Crucibulum laeve]
MASNTSNPKSSKPRKLIICFDGTSGEYDEDITNVVKLYGLLRKDEEEQLCLYEPGVGTGFSPGVVSPLFEWCAKVLDLAIAWRASILYSPIYSHINLEQNYRAGDKICIFGFSRGAYTARALAGFLFKIGLLMKDNEANIPFAYRLYKREDRTGLELCSGFKNTYCQNVKVEFMGVWDTVASVGLVMRRTLPFTNSNESIKTFRHALSLDERRAKFRPNHYHRPAPNENAASRDPESASPIFCLPLPSHSSNSSTEQSESETDSDKRSEPEYKYKPEKTGYFGFIGKRSKIRKTHAPTVVEEEAGKIDDVLEVWFAGCHSDVGGGSVPNGTVHSLANISLRWMIRETIASGCGIKFDDAALKRNQIDLNSDCTMQDKLEAVQPVYDPLKLNIFWWLLEIIPLHYSWQDEKGVWHKTWSFHLATDEL